METTNSNNQPLTESVKIAEKWFNDTKTAVSGIFTKQFNFTMDLYTEMFNSLSANNKRWNNNKDFTEMYFNNMTNITKWFSTPNNNGFTVFSNAAVSNPYLFLMDKMYKQTMEFNSNLFSSFNSTAKNSETEWNTFNNEYKLIFDRQLQASKAIFESVSNAYGKQLNYAADTNKKMMEELNEQYNSMLKQNQKIWKDAFKNEQETYEGDHKNGKEYNHNHGSKRRTHNNVVA